MDPRRQLLADTALAVIGTSGIRALTHHRVDDDAGLPRGSTSYYCRRRVDLLRLALERLYVLDEADLRAAVAGALTEGLGVQMTAATAGGGGTAAAEGGAADHTVVDMGAAYAAIAGLVTRWLEDGAPRTRSIARIELFMAASHEPELQPLMAEQFDGMRRAALPLSPSRDGGALHRFAAAFMLVDGLMLGVLREGRPAPSHRTIVSLLETLD